MGATFRSPRQHDVMDEDWRVTPVTRRLKDQPGRSSARAAAAITSSSSARSPSTTRRRALPAGKYLALLSHSGSRGTGAQVAHYYSKLRAGSPPGVAEGTEAPRVAHLSTEAGQEYWAAMNLMGRYAAANHALIHAHIAQSARREVLLDIENHHNFAWKERHGCPTDREAEVIVHRKGATPAGAGVLGIIPGSMATPGYVVRGKGVAASLNSASHGAGRV